MTKTVKIAMIAVAAFSFVACNKEVEETIVPSDKIIQLTFNSVKPNLTDVETRTVWDGETITWAKGDAIRIGYTVNDVWQGSESAATSEIPAKLYASDALAEASEVAQFNVAANFKDTQNADLTNPVYKFYGIYPSGIAKADFDNPPILNIIIPAEQTPSATSFDSSADVMYATSKDYSGIPSGRLVDLTWNRIVSHADISMRNLQVEDGETLESITVTAQTGADLAGAHTLNLTDGTVGGSGANKVVVNATNLTFSDGAVEFWFTSLPFTATELTFTVKTSKYTYVRTFESIDLNFLGNARNTLSVNMKKAVKLTNYEEDFSEGVGDFSAGDAWSAGSFNGTYYMKAQSQNAADGSWLISPKLSILDNQSELSFAQSINKYFTTIEDEATVWIREEEGEWTKLSISYPETPTSGWSSFENTSVSLLNYAGKTVQVGFKYVGTSTSYGGWEISEFKVTNATAIYDPVFTITSATTKDVSFAATTVEFTYSAAHLNSDPTVAIKAGSDDIIDGTPTIANGKITVNVKANADEVEKTATLVVTCEGVDNIPELVINQEAKSNLVETEATIDFTAMGFENAQVVTNVEQEPFTVSFTKGGNNDPKYYTSSGGSMRFYTGGTMTVSSEYTITKIVLTGTVAATVDGIAISNRTWTGSSNAVVFTATSTNQIKTLKITYLAPGSDVPATYSVNIASGIQNGTVTASKTTGIADNESVTLTVSPNSGYELESLTVDGTDVTSLVADDKYTFNMPAHDVAVSATFKSSGSVTPGEEKTVIIKSTWTGNSEQDLESLTETAGDITALFEKKTSQNGIYHSSSQIRVYQNNTITLTGGTITKVDITCSAANYNNGFTTTSGSTNSSDAVWSWEGSSTNLVLTSSGSSRILKIEVTYK